MPHLYTRMYNGDQSFYLLLIQVDYWRFCLALYFDFFQAFKKVKAYSCTLAVIAILNIKL